MESLNCPICNQPKKTNKYYSQKTCGSTDCINESRRQTNLKKYGHINAVHSKSGKRKVRNTLRKRYGSGISNVSQIESVKQKKQNTCIKNFGVSWPMQSKEVRSKSTKTLLETYGVDNISRVPEVVRKIQEKAHLVDEATGKSPFQLGREKLMEYNIKTYGVPFYFQSFEFKDKYRDTMLRKYGVDNIRKSKYFYDMMIERGIRHTNEVAKSLKEYRRQVTNSTKRTFIQYQSLLTEVYPRNIEYELDHIYSVYDGFVNGVSPEVVSSIVNLQIIPREINRGKRSMSWITKEELLDRYTKTIN